MLCQRTSYQNQPRAQRTLFNTQTKWVWVQKITHFHPQTTSYGPNLPPIYFVE